MSYIDLVSKENYDKDMDNLIVKSNVGGEIISVDDSSDAKIKYMKIESTEENVDVQVFGKNMFIADDLPITRDGITISQDKDGNVILNGTSTKTSGTTRFTLTNDLVFKKGIAYTVGFENKIIGIGMELKDVNNKSIPMTISVASKYKSVTRIFDDDVSLKYIYINVVFNTGELNNFILNPQIEIGNEATKYEIPKEKQSAIINVTTQTGWENLKTYYPNTTIASKQNAKIDVMYVADTKTYIDKKDTTEEVKLNSSKIADISAYIGLTSDYVIGLQADFENKTFTRLGGAVGLKAGEDFNKFNMYGGRKRCNVDDDGKITAYYGDDNYKEDGTNGQVMVYQPKFYYLVSPLKLDKQESGLGYHLRKANYYVSDKKLNGFKLHPAFYDAYGNEVDYILMGAYEGCIYDTSESKYLTNDEQVVDFTTDKLCSIAGVKPCSGKTQNLNIVNLEKLANNRNRSFHIETIKSLSANQLLMIIEYGKFNMQDNDSLGKGVVNIAPKSGLNCSSLTGSTSLLGNSSGIANETINTKGENTTTETENGKVSISYRGFENPYGNIWKFINGINIYGNGNMRGGQPYISNNFNFNLENTSNYESSNFTLSNVDGYISSFGYSACYDWLFLPSECLGNSSLPVGDYNWNDENLIGFYAISSGGNASDGIFDGIAYIYNRNVYSSDVDISARLVYIPNSARTDIEDVEVTL